MAAVIESQLGLIEAIGAPDLTKLTRAAQTGLNPPGHYAHREPVYGKH